MIVGTSGERLLRCCGSLGFLLSFNTKKVKNETHCCKSHLLLKILSIFFFVSQNFLCSSDVYVAKPKLSNANMNLTFSVYGSAPDPYVFSVIIFYGSVSGSVSFHQQAKKLIKPWFLLFNDFLSLKTDVNGPTESNKQKK
jgi:hypothetical protein